MRFIRILLLSSFIPWCDNDELTSYDILDWCKSDEKDIPIDFGEPAFSRETVQFQMKSSYPDGIECSLSVIPQPRHGIRVTFLWLDLPKNVSCIDYVQINTISSAGHPLCSFQSLPEGATFLFSKAIDITVVTVCRTNCYKLRNNFGFLLTLKSDTAGHRVINADGGVTEDRQYSPTSTPTSTTSSTAIERAPTPPSPPIWRPAVTTPTPRPPVTSSVALYSTLILVGILVAFAAICVVVGYCQSNSERAREEALRQSQEGGDEGPVRVTSFTNPYARVRPGLRPNTPQIIVTSPDHGTRPRSVSPLRRILDRHSRHSGSRHGLMHRDNPPPYTARVLHNPVSEDSNSESESRNSVPNDNPRQTVRFDMNSGNVDGNTTDISDRSGTSGANVSNTRPVRISAEINVPQSISRGSSPTVSPPCYACVENSSPVCFHQTSMPAGAAGPSCDAEVPRATRTRIKSV